MRYAAIQSTSPGQKEQMENDLENFRIQVPAALQYRGINPETGQGLWSAMILMAYKYADLSSESITWKTNMLTLLLQLQCDSPVPTYKQRKRPRVDFLGRSPKGRGSRQRDYESHGGCPFNILCTTQPNPYVRLFSFSLLIDRH